MLPSTVKPSLWNRSNLFIVCSKGLEFKSCDKCKLTIKDRICLCNTCKKCLHLECAGFEKKNTWYKKNTMLPAPDQELPKSCRDCLTSIRSTVGSNSNGNSWITDRLGTYTKNTLISGINRLLESDIQLAHELSKDVYDDCWDHINILGHELEQKHIRTVYSCSGCQRNSFGPHIACRNSSCSFQLHKDCKSPRKFMMHPFFLKSRFAFSSSPKIEYFKHRTVVNCNACGMDVNGYLYESLLGYKKYLHPCCANLPRQIICRESGATLLLQPNTTSNCSYCHKLTVMVGEKNINQIWSYVSESDNIHLHVPCIIKMLSDLTSSHVIGSTSLLTILPEKKTKENYSITKLEFQIAAQADAKKRWETEFKKIMKYAKIALGAIIAAVLGDPTTFIFKCIVAINS